MIRCHALLCSPNYVEEMLTVNGAPGEDPSLTLKIFLRELDNLAKYRGVTVDLLICPNQFSSQIYKKGASLDAIELVQRLCEFSLKKSLFSHEVVRMESLKNPLVTWV